MPIHYLKAQEGKDQFYISNNMFVGGGGVVLQYVHDIQRRTRGTAVKRGGREGEGEGGGSESQRGNYCNAAKTEVTM